jgi:HAD superfamily hydrolase (TIGR01509 family)
MIEAILWDNDGVLVDTEEMFFSATSNAFAQAGVALAREFYLECMMSNGRNVFDLLAQQGWTEQQVLALRGERDAAYAAMLRFGSKTFDGVAETLQLLQAKYRMAVVTTSSRSHLNVAHTHSGLSQFFELTVCREDYREPKPHPEPYLTAVRLLGVPANRCIAVEDSARGVKSAIAAGLRVVAIPNSLTKELNFTGASAILDNVRRLPDFLQNYNAPTLTLPLLMR